MGHIKSYRHHPPADSFGPSHRLDRLDLFSGFSFSGSRYISRDFLDRGFHRRICATGWVGTACSAGLCHDFGFSSVPVLFTLRVASLPTRCRLSLRGDPGSLGNIGKWVLA